MICAIVLSAGCSTRMGTQKLLLPFGKNTVVSHIVNQFIESEVEETYVVTGHQAEQVTEELSDKPVTIIHNPIYMTGMLSSVRAGVGNISSKYEAMIIALGDQPSVTTKLVNEIVRCYSETRERIIIPEYNGKRGHPLLLSTTFINEILTNFDDVGLRGLLRVHENEIYGMNVSDSSVISDMDYPEDYQREIARFEKSKKEMS